MQFKVPQFIEMEDKIVGPFTLKQFLYLAGGTGVLFVLWFILRLGAFIIAAIPVGAASLLLAFRKVNGRPFISFLGSFFKYLSKPKIYLWRRNNNNNFS